MFPVRALLLPVHVVVALASTAIVPSGKETGCVLRPGEPKAYNGLCRSMTTEEDCYNVNMTCVWVPPLPGIYATWSFHYGTCGETSGWLAKPLVRGTSEQATGWKCGGSTGTFTCALSDTTQLTAHWTLSDGSHGDGPAVSSGCSIYGGGGYFFECCFSTTPPPPPPPTPPPTPTPPPIQTLIKGLYDPENMLLDLVGGKMYFQVVYGDRLDLHTKTQRANLNGSQLEDYKGHIPGAPFAMDPERVVDVATGKLYETLSLGYKVHSVKRSNLNFSDNEIIVTNLPWPTSIALDVTRGKVYWIDTGFPAYFPNSVGGSINRANLDGSNSEIIIKGNASWTVPEDCKSIALDVESGKMYLNHHNFISRANLDGSAFENVVATGAGHRLGQIALDKKGGWLYWAQPDLGEPWDGTIKRVAFNFSSSDRSNAMLV